ncbi:MAG: hypothetical protein R3B96_21220 [Pirellulaceae bacterium]
MSEPRGRPGRVGSSHVANQDDRLFVNEVSSSSLATGRRVVSKSCSRRASVGWRRESNDARPTSHARVMARVESSSVFEEVRVDGRHP